MGPQTGDKQKRRAGKAQRAVRAAKAEALSLHMSMKRAGRKALGRARLFGDY
jgi:hypothetical protein